MHALSRLLSTGIVLFLVAFFVWLYALMKTSKQADEFMDQRWLERKWLEEHSEAGASAGLNRVGTDAATLASELYDQDKTEQP
jgi:hypothetical protein